MGTKNNKKLPTKSTKKATKPPQKAAPSQINYTRRSKVPRYLKWFIGIACAVTLLVIVFAIALKISPWPGALFIRYEFDKGGEKTSKALEKHVPAGIASVQEQQYKQGDKDAFLDVFYPNGTAAPRPTIVWVHGGAWVSGDKDTVDNYLKIVASHGYTVVGVNYSIAPGKQYPTPIKQVNEALGYLQRHADRLHVDPNNIVLAGDSAGSQIVAQLANIITSPKYATSMGIEPSVMSNQLKATVLNCGAYDLNLPKYDGADGWFLRTVLWAYSGTKDFLHDPKLQHASVVNYVTPTFPPSFITAGNVDPLEAQSREFAKKLAGLGVPTTTLFYPEDHSPKLGHEYQFDLDVADGQRALTTIITFLHTYVPPR